MDTRTTTGIESGHWPGTKARWHVLVAVLRAWLRAAQAWDLTLFRVALIPFMLIATVSAGESWVDAALLASAQKAMPREIGTNQLVRALESGLWTSNRSAVAISIAQPKASVVLVFLRQNDGTYLAVDASRVEGGNFGKLGRPRSDYERFETTPVEWGYPEGGRFLVWMRTRAWRGGQRYTVSEPLVISTNGTVLWR